MAGLGTGRMYWKRSFPELVLDDDFQPHLSHSQEIEERGLCPGSCRSVARRRWGYFFYKKEYAAHLKCDAYPFLHLSNLIRNRLVVNLWQYVAI